MGAKPPQPKSCGGDASKSPPQEFCCRPCTHYTAKMYSKNYKCDIMKLKKVRGFKPENVPKAFGGWALPGPAGELTAYRGRVVTRQGKGKETKVKGKGRKER